MGIYLELQDTLESCKGPGFWKFNTSLLSNEGYISLMEQKIPEWINENVSIEDKRVRWDFLKYQIRKESVMFSKRLAREKRKEEQELNQRYQEFEEVYQKHPNEQIN